MPRSARFRFSHPIKHLRRRKSALTTAALLGLLFFVPMTALAQGSPFDTGFNAIQTLFTGTIAKVASLVAIVIGGYGFAHGEPGAKKAGGAPIGGCSLVLGVVRSEIVLFAVCGDFRLPRPGQGPPKSSSSRCQYLPAQAGWEGATAKGCRRRLGASRPQSVARALA